jgi:hypothetical protein
MKMSGLLHAPAIYSFERISDTQYIRYWVGLSAGLDVLTPAGNRNSIPGPTSPYPNL